MIPSLFLVCFAAATCEITAQVPPIWNENDFFLRNKSGRRFFSPRSPPRFAELQSEWRAARSSNLALPETMSSRKAVSWETALSRVVLMMTRPSGSFHEAFLRDPWCFIRMCDARTWLPDDILLFFLWWWWWWWCFSFAVADLLRSGFLGSAGSEEEEDGGGLSRFLSADSILAAREREREREQ